MTPPSNKKELKSFLSMIIYLGQLSPVTTKLCNLLWKFTSAKADWTWNSMYEENYENVKAIIKDNACIKFYNKKEMYLKTVVSGVRLKSGCLQVWDGLQLFLDDNCVLPYSVSSKSLTST